MIPGGGSAAGCTRWSARTSARSPGGVWVWDDTAHLPWEVPYSVELLGAAVADAITDLADCVLPTGVSIQRGRARRCVYELGYDDGDRLQARPAIRWRDAARAADRGRLDLRQRAPLRPDRTGHRDTSCCTASTSTSTASRMRDRTWGRRPEDRPRQAAYVTGACFGRSTGSSR